MIAVFFSGTVFFQESFAQCQLFSDTDGSEIRLFVFFGLWPLVSIGFGIFSFKILISKKLKKYKKLIFSLVGVGCFAGGLGFAISILYLIVISQPEIYGSPC